MAGPDPSPPAPSDVAIRSIKSLIPGVVTIWAFSFFIAVGQLLSLFYMESVFDRVFTTRNELTLLFLTLFMTAGWLVTASLEALRKTIMLRLSRLFDRQLGDSLFAATHQALLGGAGATRDNALPMRALRDQDTLRDIIAGGALAQIADAIWTPVFLAIAFLIHPLIGLALTVVVAIMILLVAATGMLGADKSLRGLSAGATATEFAGVMLRNADTIRAMGMVGTLQLRWKVLKEESLAWESRAAAATSVPIFLSSFVARSAGTLVFALAALLAVRQSISLGNAVIAMSISYRTVGPASYLVLNWKTALRFRSALGRLRALLSCVDPSPVRLSLGRPAGTLAFENVTIGVPGARAFALADASFTCGAGQVLGVIGPSGAGKSSLAKAAVGAWRPLSGTIRLDGGDIQHWAPEELGKFLGYLPQEVELFPGSVAQNIARFQSFGMEEVIRAATLAGVHEMIQALPDGYNTEVGEGGRRLPGGQRQRVGLARAVYGDPALVVLDEPNSNLDSMGEQALAHAIEDLRRRGTTVLIVTHRTNLLSLVDLVLFLAEGRVQTFGPPETLLTRLAKPKVVRLGTMSRGSLT